MDRDVIERKLESLRRYISRIESKQPFPLERLETDADLQDILALNLTQAIQTVVDIGMHILARTGNRAPETMAEVFDVLDEAGILSPDLADRMKRAVGFRNIAVHAYGQVNWRIVFAICERHLSDFREFARRMVAYLDGAGG